MITLGNLAGINEGDRVQVTIISEQCQYGVVNPLNLGEAVEGEYVGIDENINDKISTKGCEFLLLVAGDKTTHVFHDWLVEKVEKI